MFLAEGVPMIPFVEIKNNTLEVMKKILGYFEAKGVRNYIRTETYGKSEIFFYNEANTNQIIGKIIDISSHAFLCDIEEKDKNKFIPGKYYNDVLLILKGIRIKTAVKLIGFSSDNKNHLIFKFVNREIVNNKILYSDKIHPELLHKVHAFIKDCLRENMDKIIGNIKDNIKDKEE